MTADIRVADGVWWSAQYWLFGWVLIDITKYTADAQLIEHLREIVDAHLGWFGFDDLTEDQSDEVQRIITEQLVSDAEREFPADMFARPSALTHVADLVALISGGPEAFEAALRLLGPRDQHLAAVVKKHLAAGQAQAEVLAELTRFREELARAGRDEDEDIVLEVMDYVAGWASPHQKL